MSRVLIYTAPCDRCGRDGARWLQRGNEVVVLPGDFEVTCPACDPQPA